LKKEPRVDFMVIWLIGMLTASPMNLCSLPDGATRALVSVSDELGAALGSIGVATDAISRKIDEGIDWLNEDLPLQGLYEDEFEWE
jgi:hypothetical protein